MRADGWAVIWDDRIIVRSVSDTRRSAIVNWLVVVCGILVTNFTRDDEIECYWEANSQPRGARVVKVIVMEDDSEEAERRALPAEL